MMDDTIIEFELIYSLFLYQFFHINGIVSSNAIF